MADGGGGGGGAVIGTVLLVGFFAAIYLVPSFLAFSREHRHRWAILAVNVLLGVTAIGWGVAFIWALATPEDAGPPDDPQRGR